MKLHTHSCPDIPFGLLPPFSPPRFGGLSSGQTLFPDVIPFDKGKTFRLIWRLPQSQQKKIEKNR
jgi:hypothetical protein